MRQENICEQQALSSTQLLDQKLGLDKNQRSTLDAVGIEDPRDFAQYFNLMRKIDLPFKHALPNFDLLEKGVTTPEDELHNWEIIKKSYDNFDWLSIGKVPSLEALFKVKKMVDLFDRLFRQFVHDRQTNPTLDIPAELHGLLLLLKVEADNLNKCQAYIAYKFYGLYQIDPVAVPPDEYFRNR